MIHRTVSLRTESTSDRTTFYNHTSVNHDQSHFNDILNAKM